MGKSFTNAEVHFEIVSAENKSIYNERFTGSDLLGDLGDTLTDAQKADTIKKRFEDFFDDKAFTNPAVKKTDKPDSDYTDLQTFNEIKADPAAVGFTYAQGYEGIYSIAYSKKQHKTVKYFTYN